MVLVLVLRGNADLGPFLSKRLNPRFQIPVLKYDRLLAALIPPPEQNPRFEPGNPRFGGDLEKSERTYLNPLFKRGLRFVRTGTYLSLIHI